MKPPISYYGGKQRQAPSIVPLLPRHTVYVEPFAGGAAVFFAKPWPPATSADHYREVLNDQDNRLINFYRVLRDPIDGPELIRRLSLTPYSRDEYRVAGRRLDGSDDAIEWARAYFVQANMSFANKPKGGWSTAVFGMNRAASYLNKVKRLSEYLGRMASVHIECDDALAVVERWDSPQTCFYCDPPYPGADQGHYSGYTLEDFQCLIDALDSAHGSFVLSNYDQPGAHIPEHWERFEFSAVASSSGAGVVGKGRDKTRAAAAEEMGDRSRTEVVWRMDRSGGARDEIQKVWKEWQSQNNQGLLFG